MDLRRKLKPSTSNQPPDVLVIGDYIVDHTLYVTTNRKAAEADIPVYKVLSEKVTAGGAGNTAHCLHALGAGVWAIYDEEHIYRYLHGWPFVTHSWSYASVKQRAVYQTSVVSRIDFDCVVKPDKEKLFANIARAAESVNKYKGKGTYKVVAIADYGKGLVSDSLVMEVKKLFPKSRILVEPRNVALNAIKGCIVKGNHK